MKRASTAMDVDTAESFRRKRFRASSGKNPRGLTPLQARGVQRLIDRNTELKYFQYNSTATNVTTTATLTGIPFDVPQATTSSTDVVRIGDAIKLKSSLDFRYTVFVGDTTNLVRVMIIQWKAQSTAAPFPTAADILLAGPSGAVDVHSHYSHDERFNIGFLYDKVHSMVGDAGAATTPYTTSSQITVNKRISLRRAAKNVQYRGGGGQGINRLFLLYVSDSNAVAHPTIVYATKMKFTDA